MANTFGTLVHLRPSVGKEVVGSVALCGAAPELAGYREITAAEYVALFMPSQHPTGRICGRCAGRLKSELSEHVRRGG